MAKFRPTIVRLRDLAPGQLGDFFAILAERVRGATRDGKPYFTCRFRDGARSVTSMVWSDSPLFEPCEQSWREGAFYKVRAKVTDHERFGLQIDIVNIREATEADRAEGFDPGELVEASRFDRGAMFLELRGIVEKHIADTGLKKLVLTLLDRHGERFRQLPASVGRFYTFVGGLLEHTLSVTRSCLHLVEKYREHYPDLKPPINGDIVVAGAVLHDIGRVQELGDEVPAQQTVPGRLTGYIVLGRDMVRDAARELGDVNPELVQLLEHVILSHLTLPEWGSPRLPLIPECIILHHADDLDAKLEMYVRCLMRDQGAGPFTDRDPQLGRQLFKGRTV